MLLSPYQAGSALGTNSDFEATTPRPTHSRAYASPSGARLTLRAAGLRLVRAGFAPARWLTVFQLVPSPPSPRTSLSWSHLKS